MGSIRVDEVAGLKELGFESGTACGIDKQRIIEQFSDSVKRIYEFEEATSDLKSHVPCP